MVSTVCNNSSSMSLTYKFGTRNSHARASNRYRSLGCKTSSTVLNPRHSGLKQNTTGYSSILHAVRIVITTPIPCVDIKDTYNNFAHVEVSAQRQLFFVTYTCKQEEYQ